MWKPTMATRLLLLLAVSMVVGGAAAAGGSPSSWCVCRPGASELALQSTLDYACANGGDCRPLHPGGQCHGADTLLARCSYAANSYFHKVSQANEHATCDFGGAAALSQIDPSSETCTYPAYAAAAPTADDGATASPPEASKAEAPTADDCATEANPPEASKAAAWCVCQPGLPDAALQRTLDYACGHGADCEALSPGGRCHVPNTLLAHCSYAANSYFRSNKGAACDFAGTAGLSSMDPSSGTCKYPATDFDSATSPEAEKIPLRFVMMGLTACVLCVVLLSVAVCACGSSARAQVSGGAAMEEETDTAVAVAAEEEGPRPITSTCPVCFDDLTNLGPHRICCLPCGHVFGRSCLERWLWIRGNSIATCPKCIRSFQHTDIITLYGPVVSASTAPEPADTVPLQLAQVP